jgi:pimeloyl-ACP methyl ester carboxylesterase
MEGLHHRDEGSGPPVVLLHGLASTVRVFDDVIAQGSSRYRFVAVDLPRSGRSKQWASAHPGDIAEKLMPWLEKRGLRRFALVGHSFGGLVALELAARKPAAVSQLIVASAPALGLPQQARRMLENPASDMAMGWLARLPMYRPWVRRYFEWLWVEANTLTDRHVDMYEEALRAEGVWQGMLESFRAIASWRLPLETLRAAKLPAKVLWGEKDPLVPLIHGEHLATSLNAPFSVLSDIGHCVPEQRPAEILKALG